MKKAVVLLLTIFCFICLYYFTFSNSEVGSATPITHMLDEAKQVAPIIKNGNESEAILSSEKIEDDSSIKMEIIFALKKCMSRSEDSDERFYSSVKKSIGNIQRQEPVWTNIHLEKNDGHTYKIRVFNSDSENGVVRKLVYFKDDDEGFPQILKKHLRPTSDLFTAYMKNGKIIYNEVATRYITDTGVEVFVQKIDDEIKRLKFSFMNKEIDCRQ